ncbi:glutamate receptor-interacting protein 2-like isoform X11 [Portunus trituberculatus]|uniref:glutamate receptor-interacting protein 2-like isoform X11 n=1 Tax=Portunus trituberculatus TaxID=210409 RepID=UPI001E1D0829|nr:glutamate receptor-interacting protein 2-like isoform X11 [Portunus trituberculatus]
MSSGWRLDWRGSSGSLWSRNRGHGGPDSLDLLSGAQHVSSSPTAERGRRSGLRKRFLSLTEGLAGFLAGDRKEKDKDVVRTANFRPFDHSRDLVTSEFWPDQTNSLRGSSNSLSAFREAPSVPSRSSSRQERTSGHTLPTDASEKSENGAVPARCRTPTGPIKAPPSPPPRRFSLWAVDVQYSQYYYSDQIISNANPSSASPQPRPPSSIPIHCSPPSPRPAIKGPPLSAVRGSSTPPRSPHTPRRQPSPKSETPPTSRVGSPVMRGRSLSDSKVEGRGKGSSRAAWYRRKSQARRNAQSPVQGSGCVVARTVGVLLEKEENSFGFTVRGGTSLDPSKTRPLIITHVRPGGPADREGTIKAGDRLVAVDGRDLSHCSLKDAQEMLQRIERAATLTIEYDVSVMESVRASGGPLLVEIERAAGTSLGISLTSAHPEPSTIIIETIRPASIAERCGALAVNDVVAAIDGTRLDQLTVAEAAQLLKTAPGSHVTLEIIPGPAAQSKIPFCRGGGVAFPHLYGVVGSSSGYNSSGGGGGGGYLSPGSSYNTLTSQRTRSSAARRVNRRPRPGDRSDTASLSSHTTGGSVGGAGVGVCHSECLTVTLVVEGRGYGLVLRPPPHATDPDTALPFVAAMDPGGPADKCSVICVGDRIMGVNGRSVSGLGVSEVTQMVANSRPTVTLDVEFDVADSVVPSSGTFAVKLAKRHNGLGITLTVSRRAGAGEPLLISEVVRGSPAHRSGTMQPGDRLLAIDSTRLEHLTLEDAKSILHCCDDIVTLRVQKDELYSEESGSLVMYTVELVRHGGALGITISGSEEPFDPIYIAGLAPGGLADRTGAIHVGDRLLAINGVSLRGKPLSEAILMLQNSGDTVTLKISRPRDSGVTSDDLGRNDWLGRFGPAIPSVDSAVESWDSSGLDPVPPGSTPALSKRDSGSDIVFRSDCGSTVRRRAGNEGREELAGSGDTDNSEANKRSMEGDMDEARRSPSPPPSIDSGQSEDKTDWDKMIADLNQISESCGLRELPHTSHTHLSHTRTVSPQLHKEVHVSGLEGLSSTKTIGDTALCPTLASRRRAGDRSDVKEEGSYSVSHATLTYSRTTSPPRHVTFPAADGGQVYQVTLHKDCIYEDFGFSVSDGLYEKGVYVNRIRKAGPADRSGVLKPYDRILQVNDTRTHDFDCCLTVPLMAAAGDRLVLVVSRNPHAHPTLDFSSDVLSPTWNSIEESKEEEEEEEEHDLAQEHGSPLYSPLTPSLTPIPTVLKTL